MHQRALVSFSYANIHLFCASYALLAVQHLDGAEILLFTVGHRQHKSGFPVLIFVVVQTLTMRRVFPTIAAAFGGMFGREAPIV